MIINSLGLVSVVLVCRALLSFLSHFVDLGVVVCFDARGSSLHGRLLVGVSWFVGLVGFVSLRFSTKSMFRN